MGWPCCTGATAAAVLLLLCGGLLLPSAVQSLDNGQALTPPQGFANWNGFGCNYDDQTFRTQVGMPAVVPGP